MRMSYREHIKLMDALHYAAELHRFQLRKGAEKTPYINHPIEVTHTLTKHNETNVNLLCASLLHDIIEDTTNNEAEVELRSKEILELFGEEVLLPVLEVSDNKNLPVEQRKKLQIEMIGQASINARKIRIADKLCNIHDLFFYPPKGWPTERKIAYIKWAQKVVENAKGVNLSLEKAFTQKANDILTKLYS